MSLRDSIKHVVNAVHELKDTKGATVKQIIDFIDDVRGGSDVFAVRKALDRCVDRGVLQLSKGRYRLGVDEREVPGIIGARRRGKRLRNRSGRRQRKRSRMVIDKASGLGDEIMRRRRRKRRRHRRRRTVVRVVEQPDSDQERQVTNPDPVNSQNEGNDVEVEVKT